MEVKLLMNNPALESILTKTIAVSKNSKTEYYIGFSPNYNLLYNKQNCDNPIRPEKCICSAYPLPHQLRRLYRFNALFTYRACTRIK